MQKFYLLLLLVISSLNAYSYDKDLKAKSDSLFSLGVALYDGNDFNSALDIFSKCYELDAELDYPHQNLRDYSSHWLAACYKRLGNDSIAYSINRNIDKFAPIDRRVTAFSDSLFIRGLAELNGYNIEKSYEYFRQCGRLELENLGYSPFYTQTLSYLITTAAHSNNNKAAISYFLSSYNFLEHYKEEFCQIVLEHYSNIPYILQELTTEDVDAFHTSLKNWLHEFEYQVNDQTEGLKDEVYARLTELFYLSSNDLNATNKIIETYRELLQEKTNHSRDKLLFGILSTKISIANSDLDTAKLKLLEAFDDYFRNVTPSITDSQFLSERLYNNKFLFEELNILDRYIIYGFSLFDICPPPYIAYKKLGITLISLCRESPMLYEAGLNLIDKLLSDTFDPPLHYSEILPILLEKWRCQFDNEEYTTVINSIKTFIEQEDIEHKKSLVDLYELLFKAYSKIGDTNGKLDIGNELLHLYHDMILEASNLSPIQKGQIIPIYIVDVFDIIDNVYKGDLEKVANSKEEFYNSVLCPISDISEYKLLDIYSRLASSYIFAKNIEKTNYWLDIYTSAVSKDKETEPFRKYVEKAQIHYLNGLAQYVIYSNSIKQLFEYINAFESQYQVIKELSKSRLDTTTIQQAVSIYFQSILAMKEDIESINEDLGYLYSEEIFNISSKIYNELLMLNPTVRIKEIITEWEIMNLQNIVTYYQLIGNQNKFLSVVNERRSLEHITTDSNISLSNSIGILYAYNHLANLYEPIDREFSLNIYKQLNSPEIRQKYYQLYLSNYIDYYNFNKDYQQLSNIEDFLFKEIEYVSYQEAIDNSLTLAKLIIYQSIADDIDISKFIPFLESVFLKSPEYNEDIARVLFENAVQGHNINSIVELYPQYYENVKESLTQEMSIHDHLLFQGENVFIHGGNISPNIIYDNLLCRKNRKLEISISYNNLISESTDSLIVKQYNNISDLREQLSNSTDSIFIFDKFITVEQAQHLLRTLDDELTRRSYDLYHIDKNLKFSFIDVQKRLTDQDLAIEFSSFSDINNHPQYAAVIMSDKGDCQFILLPVTKDITNFDYNDIQREILTPLEPFFKGKTNIYVSLDGKLNNLPLESTWNLTHAHAGQKLIRLSSTREIAISLSASKSYNASVFGGLDYNMDVKDLPPAKHPCTNNTRDFDLIDSTNLRSGVKELPYTKVEADSINNLLSASNYHSNNFTSSKGTETEFKNLNASSQDIVHIATHGFYWTERDLRKSGLTTLLSGGNSKRVGQEDAQLLRSGLLFSGANNFLLSKSPASNTDDGILTAKEISELDLRQFDLVVLSACQTALGDISEDGVIGLQRGFKKAGANTILMALWKVDDRATQLLMIKFYEYLLSGKTKTESLILAQKYLREYEEEIEIDDTEEQNLTASQKRRLRNQEDVTNEGPSRKIKVKPYSDPKYWAAFILLDALN